MRRVMILGSPGSGKSTLARALGRKLGLPVYHLDRLYHRPGWQEPLAGVFEAAVARITALPEWIIDGNYPSTASSRLAAADTLVYLHVSRPVALARILKRSLLGFGRQRRDAAEGCRERIDPAFLRYVWRWRDDAEPGARHWLETFDGSVIELRSAREITAFLRKPA